MEEWKKVRLKDVIKEVNQRNKGEKVKRVLSVTNSRGFVSQDEYFEGTVHSANIANYKIVRKNQFAYNPSRVNVGSIDILKDYEDGALSPMYVVFEVDTTKLLPEYFKYYFQTNRFYENVKNNTQGSVRNSLNFKALADFDYLLPPIKEQEKIVKILENIDMIIEKNIYESTLINYQNKSYIKKVLDINKLRKIEWIKLKEISSNITKGTTPKKFTNNGIRFIKIEALNGENIDNKRCSFIARDEHIGYLKRSILEEDDILFAIAGATIGKCAIVKKENLPANTNQALSIIRLKNKQDSKYIIKVLESNLMKKYISMNLTAGAQPNLNLEQIGNFKIPQLNKEERKKFLKVVDLYEKKIMLLNNKKEEYVILKKFLIQKLLTGKVKVNV